jgi:sugar phosphate permease
MLTRAQWRTLSIVWATYGAFYFCRVNIGAARSDIEKALSINPLEMGLILGSLKVGYAIGQLVNGQLAERFGPKRILLVGMVGSISACLLFASAEQVGAAAPSIASGVNAIVRLFSATPLGPMAALLLVIWFLNGYFQAGGWPPSVRVMASWFTPEQRGKMMGIIGTSYQLGSALTIFAAGALVSAFADWRAAFVVPAAAFGLAAVHAAVRLREHPSEGEAPAVLPQTKERAPVLESLWLTLTSGKIWILAIALFGLDIVRYGFLDWAPGHLKQVHGTGTASAALKAAVFPLAGAFGALVSGYATDRWFQSRRAPVIAFTMGMVGVLTLLYGRVVSLGAAPTVAILAAIGFFLYGAQILLVGTAAQDFAQKHRAASAAGFIDFMGYMGAFGGDVVTGWLLKHQDFHAASKFWAAAAIVAALLCATLWNARPAATPVKASD